MKIRALTILVYLTLHPVVVNADEAASPQTPSADAPDEPTPKRFPSGAADLDDFIGKDPSVEEVLKVFGKAKFEDEGDVRAALRAAADSKASVSYIHLAWSAASEIRKRDFAKFVLSEKRRGLKPPVTVHFIDCTPITDDYSEFTAPLHLKPAYDQNQI